MGSSSVAVAYDGKFQIGPQIGVSRTKATGDVYGHDTAVSGGLVVRYTVPMSDSGLFVGFQAGVTRESASGGSSEGGVSVELDIDWSMDFMPMVGYRMGKTSLSVAAGFSNLYGDLEFDVAGVSFSDSNWHAGWKIAPGIDYQISENMALFGQAYYANYGSDSYNIAGASVNFDLETYGTQFGVLFSF